MNLIVVDKCTNYCSYCFAATEMAKARGLNSLSRHGIEEVADFVRRSGPNFDLNVIGGEPFLYVDLLYLLDRLYQESALRSVTIFTGAIFHPDSLRAIAHHADRLVLLVNLNEFRDYRRTRDYELVHENLKLALELGLRVVIGFNIWRDDFEYTEILAVCRQYGIEQLRWTVAYPEAVPAAGVTVLSPAEYPQVARRCVKFLEEAYQQGIDAYLDCPLPKCFFTPAEIGRILLTQPGSATAIRSCGPVVDVAPDLSVFRCFALSNVHRGRLSDFSTFGELVKWFEANIDERYSAPVLFEACGTCEFAANRTCFGGCMAHNVASIGGRVSARELLSRAHEVLANGDPMGARQLLRHVPGKDSLAALLWAYVAMADGDLESARRWARTAVNRSRSGASRSKARAFLAQLRESPPLSS